MRIQIIISAFLVLLASCAGEKRTEDFVESNLNTSIKQAALLLYEAEKQNNLPRSLTPKGEVEWIRTNFDWTEGFFPGTCWYLYEYTKDDMWKTGAEKLQQKFESHKFYTTNHDLGFVFNNSFGNAYRITGNEAYKTVMVEAAKSLSTRFNKKVGCLKSWDVSRGWQAKRGWQYPVIIDNMMNLELLFEVSEMTKDDTFRNIAITHANTTLKNHFREDNSSFHVVDYDSINGNVRKRETAQGYAHESMWARGQAWGLYGFTMCYRYTKDKKYLDQAVAIADLILNNNNLPKDKVPYWDFDAPKIPDEPRDASAAAIIASALLELDTYAQGSYAESAETILTSLSSEVYRSKIGENGNFILKHSVGSIPHGAEIDVPLSYADYYYIEALMRMQKKKLLNNIAQAKSNKN